MDLWDNILWLAQCLLAFVGGWYVRGLGLKAARRWDAEARVCARYYVEVYGKQAEAQLGSDMGHARHWGDRVLPYTLAVMAAAMPYLDAARLEAKAMRETLQEAK